MTDIKKPQSLSGSDDEKLGENGGSIPIPESDTSSKQIVNEYIVDFDAGDPTNPLNWSMIQKWSIVCTFSSLTFVATIATSMCIPAAPQILSAFHVKNNIYITILVSIWELGEAFGPFLMAPLSEIYGRFPVVHVANSLFVIFAVASAVSSNLSMLIAFRFLNGATVAVLSLNTSVISDMFPQEELGGVQAISYFPLLLGIIVAPVIGGYLAQAAGWRWVFWLVVIAGAACELSFLLSFRESYKVVILEKKAERVRRETGNQAYRSICTPENHTPKRELFKQAFVRPAKIIFFAPTVPLLSIFNAMTYAYSYLILTTMTEVFEKAYGVSEGTVGLMFLGKGVGGVLALVFLKLWDRYMMKQKETEAGMKPEHRLPPMIVGGIVTPAALFLYGWSANFQLPWILPVIGTGVLAFAVVIVALSAYAYIADAFPTHVASGIAATVVLQNVVGALLPIVGGPLNAHLGVGWASTLLGFVALVTLPIPLFLMSKYGEQIRKRS